MKLHIEFNLKIFCKALLFGPLLFLIVLFFLPQEASCKEREVRVLFIGNSLSSANDLPQMIADLAKSRGHILQYDVYAPGGYRLFNHAQDPVSFKIIKTGAWDYIIPQEQGQYLGFSEYQIQKDVYPYAAQLCKTIRDVNPKTKIIFYLNMARKNGDPGNMHVAEELGTYSGMQKRITQGYLNMAEKYHTLIAPVGRVWEKIRSQNPSMELYADDSHPNLIGTYLVASVLYEVIFKESAKGLSHPREMDNNTAVLIQETTEKIARAPGWDFTDTTVGQPNLVEGLDAKDLRAFVKASQAESAVSYKVDWHKKKIQYFDEDGQLVQEGNIELHPNAETYNKLARMYSDKGNYDKAILNLTKVIELNPNDAQAYNFRGAAYLLKFNEDQAIADFTKAIELDSHFGRAYYNRSVADTSKREYDKAWSDLHKAEELGEEARPDFLRKLRNCSGRQN